MALNVSELQRLKQELFFNQLTLGADAYVGVSQYFELVVLPWLQAGAVTSSTATVHGCGSPTTVALAVASTTGISAMDRVIVDVDDLQEEATVASIQGSSIVVRLSKSHGGAGAYPVSVEGGESMVRWHLARLRKIADRIDKFGSRAGIKKAEEIEFFGGAGRTGQEHSGFRTLSDMQQYFRKELCMLVFGVGNLSQFGSGGSRVGVY